MSLDLGSCKNVKIQSFKDNETCYKKKIKIKINKKIIYIYTFKTLEQIQ